MALEGFHRYLVGQGYKEYTPAGHPSTAADYCKRVERVCDAEGLTLSDLAKNIDVIVAKYDKGGAKEDEGNASRKAVINALKRFKEYVEGLK